LQANRTVRVSPWALGSLSRKTAFVARISRSPVCVLTISAPNGTGCEVFRERAVNSKISRMRSSSFAVTPDVSEVDKGMPQFIILRAPPAASPLFNFCIETI
jgi:hypothetical protein